MDLIVAGAVVAEIKAVERLAPVHDAQLLTYLRPGGWKVGLLIDFNECAFKFLRQFPCCVKAFAGASWDLKSKPLRLRASAVIGKPRRSIPRKSSCQKHAELRCIGMLIMQIPRSGKKRVR